MNIDSQAEMLATCIYQKEIADLTWLMSRGGEAGLLGARVKHKALSKPWEWWLDKAYIELCLQNLL